MPVQLSIIIVSYNTKDLLIDCLQSIYKYPVDFEFEVIVVDNHSIDDTVTTLKQYFPLIRLIKNSQNIGFAAANNQAAKKARGRKLLFLNSDTAVKKNALQDFFTQADATCDDIYTCQLMTANDQIQPQGGSLPNLWNVATWMLGIDDLPIIRTLIPPYQRSSSDFFSRDRKMGWVSGTAMMIPTGVFRSLGGFDEQVFMYGEDVELCLRLAKTGRKIYFLSSSKIVHLGQGSGSSSKALLGEFQGIKYIFIKHKPAWHLPILRFWLKIGALLRYLIFGIIKGNADKKIIYQQAFGLA